MIKNQMIEPNKGHKEYLMERLQDPEEAKSFINALFEQDDKQALILGLQVVIETLSKSSENDKK